MAHLDSPVWDIKDMHPVEVPDESGASLLDGGEIKNVSQFRRDVELDRYEKAVMAMPKLAQARFIRSMQTAGAILRIIVNSGRI